MSLFSEHRHDLLAETLEQAATEGLVLVIVPEVPAAEPDFLLDFFKEISELVLFVRDAGQDEIYD